MATSSEPRTVHVWTWVGLALFVAGAALWVFPLLPVSTFGGGAMRGVPHLPAWETSGLAGLGIGIMLGARRKKWRPTGGGRG